MEKKQGVVYAFIISSIQGTEMVFLQLSEVPYLEDLKPVGFFLATIPLMPLQRKSD